MDLEKMMEVMIEEIHELNKTIAAKGAQIAALTEQVAKLSARIEELTHK